MKFTTRIPRVSYPRLLSHGARLVLLLTLALPSPALAQINVSLTYTSAIPANVRSLMAPSASRAVDDWQAQLLDPVDVNVTVLWEAQGENNFKGFANVRFVRVTYAAYRAALQADQTSADDQSTLSSLPTGDSFPLLLNFGAENPFGTGSATPYFDDDGSDNNRDVRIPRALARALGFIDARDPGLDGTILFNSDKSWDFDSRDGVDVEDEDYESTFLHELGHILGFTSRLDARLIFASRRELTEDQYNYITPFDLFSFSERSLTFGFGTPDWTADDRPKFFSLDGGRNMLQPIAKGKLTLETDTRGHWENRIGLETAIGIMDPRTVAFQAIREPDLRVMDVIGWDRIPSAVELAVGLTGEQLQLSWSPPSPARVFSASRADQPFSEVFGGTYTENSWRQSLALLGDKAVFRLGSDPAARRLAFPMKILEEDSERCPCGLRH